MARRPDIQSGPARLAALVRSSVPPMHPAGLPFVGASLAVAALGRRKRWLRNTGLTAAAANAAFFRHPPRVPPTRPGLVVAPADGLDLPHRGGGASGRTRPARNAVAARQHLLVDLGRARAARPDRAARWSPSTTDPESSTRPNWRRASEDNERNSVVIRTADGRRGDRRADRRPGGPPHRVRRRRWATNCRSARRTA